MKWRMNRTNVQRLQIQVNFAVFYIIWTKTYTPIKEKLRHKSLNNCMFLKNERIILFR